MRDERFELMFGIGKRSMFFKAGQACDGGRLAEIEASIGRVLPDGYRKVLKKSGGGVLGERYCFLPLPEEVGDDGLIVDQIYGNGRISGGDNNLDGVVAFLAREWEVPAEVQLFATTELGMHVCLAINYELEGFPEGAILALDMDGGGQALQVAGSFEEFVGLLGPDPDSAGMGWTEPDEKDSVLKGALSADLREGIRRSGVEDAEALVRSAGLRVAREGSLALYNTEECRPLLDVIFWLASGLRDFSSADEYIEGDGLTFDSLAASSFFLEGQEHGLGWNVRTLELWWAKREKEGVLVDVGGHFEFTPEYLEQLFADLRSDR
ncbi:SMI1/KNR4 family protein [Corynebacterium sp. NPDC060344]|uniref:SMI1/KNR4 family protein n=1 Tax=Corynebacterium sp. NPDC060344 TaxID=3347101 RepID=UPI0036576362